VTFRRPLAAAAALAAPVAVAPAAPAAARAGHDRLEAAIVREVNEARADHGLRALRPSPRLARVAGRHSGDQLRRGALSHTSLSGASPALRVRTLTTARGVGETVAFLPGGAVRAARVVRLWLASPPHRAALLRPAYRRIGVGRVPGALSGRAGTVVTANLATAR
jgi:uncharacterized protein YkwD